MAPRSSAPATSSARHDAVTATALTVLRRALIEGVPVTREVLEREASVNLAIRWFAGFGLTHRRKRRCSRSTWSLSDSASPPSADERRTGTAGGASSGSRTRPAG